MDIDALTDDEVIDLQAQLTLRSERMQITPDVEAAIRSRLATLEEDRKHAVPWSDVRQRLGL